MESNHLPPTYKVDALTGELLACTTALFIARLPAFGYSFLAIRKPTTLVEGCSLQIKSIWVRSSVG